MLVAGCGGGSLDNPTTGVGGTGGVGGAGGTGDCTPGGTGTGGQLDTCVDACTILPGKRFGSVSAMLSCGSNGSNPPLNTCSYFLWFRDGTYSWQHSDVFDGGEYSCNGLTITFTRGGLLPGTGTLHMNDHNHLTWAGDEYVLQVD